MVKAMDLNDVLVYSWLLAIAVILLFIVTHGWRALPRWQRWYLIISSIALPFLLYGVFAVAVEGTDIGKMIRDPEYRYELIVVILWSLVVYIGIGAGLVLLVKMIAEKVRSWNRSGLNP